MKSLPDFCQVRLSCSYRVLPFFAILPEIQSVQKMRTLDYTTDFLG